MKTEHFLGQNHIRLVDKFKKMLNQMEDNFQPRKERFHAASKKKKENFNITMRGETLP